MSKFSAIVCDHCDKRDVLENPPVHGIKSYQLKIYPYVEVGGTTQAIPAPLTDLKADLCDECYKVLTECTFNLMTQVQRTAQPVKGF